MDARAHSLRNEVPLTGHCLHVTIDAGTNNDQLLKDEFYFGLRQRRAKAGLEYAELLDEFMSAVKQNYGEKILVQFLEKIIDL
ncbi:hypothetical protein RJ639_010091 [Escallonia herrerae]|uniref:Malic enzyme N-terminal domain-containing protein n=1 Tax=Escallonia herrerae TaxID=1293975 RepID=A0AA89AX19_9ASTE|nr:hypothetical protein RJ639_010091 [Escallonia herrerae]